MFMCGHCQLIGALIFTISYQSTQTTQYNYALSKYYTVSSVPFL